MATWRDWATLVEWDGDVDPAIKERLGTFLDLAMAKVAILAAGLHDASDLDIVAALSGHLQEVSVALASDAEETAREIHEWAILTADEPEVSNWRLGITWTLEDDPPAVQFVTVATLLERICHAVVAGCPELDNEDVLDAAADRLEQHTRSVLVDVLTGRISASTYRVM
jgi:hypothetical protein